MVLQGLAAAGREIWLGVDLRRGGANTTGWVQGGELQREVASGGGWLARLEDGMWRSTTGCAVGPSSGPVAGHRMRGAM